MGLTAAADIASRTRGLTIGVLGNAADPSSLAIARELKGLGADAPVIDLADVTLVDGALRWKGAPMPHLDGAIGYHGALVPRGGMNAMREMQSQGVTFVNTPASIRTSRDKWNAGHAMQRAGVATPETRLVRTKDDVLKAVKELGSPTIFKLRIGTEGRGVYKVTDPGEALPIAETVFATRHNLVAQEMVNVDRPSDIRAFVVGDRVIASMERTANSHSDEISDFRANVSNGGSARAIQLSPEDEATAVAAAKAMGLDVAGVDLMGEAGAMKVIEANSGPGQRISEVTGVNVARAIAEHALTKVTEGAALLGSSAARSAESAGPSQAREGVRLLITAVDRDRPLSEAPRYLQQRAREAGHEADIVRIWNLTRDEQGQFFHEGKPFDISGYDAVIARGGASHHNVDIAMLRAIEATGIPTLNPPDAIEVAGSKWRTAQVLKQAGVPHPDTLNIVSGSTDEITAQIDNVLEHFGSSPLVLKPASDLGGNGIMFWPGSSDPQMARVSLRSLVDSQLPTAENGLVVQPWIQESKGLDTRTFVVRQPDDSYEIVGAYQRVPPDGVGAANVARGATAHPVVPDDDLRRIAPEAARAVGLENGAVDFIRGDDGWKVVEVNSSANLRAGTEQDAGGDVTGAILNQAITAARASKSAS